MTWNRLSMRRFVLSVLFITWLLSPLATAAASAAVEHCRFVLGFKTLHDLIPDVVGDCRLSLITSSLSLWIAYNTYDRLPPSPEPLLRLMEDEATATRNGDVEWAMSLFAPNAVVRDAGGENGKILQWSGHTQIRQRYSSLPRFSSLNYNGAVVTFDDTKIRAAARASTNGEYVDAEGKAVPIASIDGERCTFRQIGGVWKIVSFVYNAP
ncbi:MAG: hypothetical protein EPO21_09925 [Chloroflexota bacterium]|nr:MAG: hypothetical protein EPO21_09925 [Chloroflexota bacterium]